MSETSEIIPLVLKYRPKSLDEVVGRTVIVNELKAYLESGVIPNLMFEGLPGTGKTLLIDLLIKEYYKDIPTTGNILKIDASTNNSVAFIRDTIALALRTMSGVPGYKKIIFLDESDELSQDAQAALRRPIEKALATHTVFMACNYVNKIILPIQDRFTIYSFGPIPKKDVDDFVIKVCDSEKIEISGDRNKVLELLYRNSRGTIRRVLNNFLEPARFTGVLSEETIIAKCPENPSFIMNCLAGKPKNAISLAIENPRGCLTGSINFIKDYDEAKMPLEVKTKMIDWIVTSLRDISLNVPYDAAITNVAYKLSNAVKKKKPAEATKK